MNGAASISNGDQDRAVSGHFADDLDGMRLDRALAICLDDLSRERIKSLIGAGQVALAGETATQPSLKVAGGMAFCVTLPEPAPDHVEPQNIPLDVLYEDGDLLVLDKPAGMVVHPAAGHARGTLVNALLHHCAGQLSGIGGVARPGIVHRIDKDTSGLLVVAKTDKAHIGLSEQFARHSVRRLYEAVTSGVPMPASGRIEGNIGRSDRDRKKMAMVGAGKGKTAITHYGLVERLHEAALVHCRLETGRTHQVRVHMASIGNALIGDPLYGRPRKAHRALLASLGFARQALHAAELGFIHPASDKELHFARPMPGDLRELCAALRV